MYTSLLKNKDTKRSSTPYKNDLEIEDTVKMKMTLNNMKICSVSFTVRRNAN